MQMLEKIKIKHLQKNILKYLQRRQILNIFKTSKFYQSKFDIDKHDYLLEYFKHISFDKTDFDTKENDIFDKLKKNNIKIISNEITKENLIKYLSINDNLFISINNIYFNQILKEKVLLNKKRIKIFFDFDEYLSQDDIINIKSTDNSDTNVECFIKERIGLYNNVINKLENLLNSDIFIEEVEFNDSYDYSSTFKLKRLFIVDYNKDMINYKDNNTPEEKNILINLKIKRGELINKILEKNCRYITKMKYIAFDEQNMDDKKIICPLVNIDKFVNLVSLHLYIVLIMPMMKD